MSVLEKVHCNITRCFILFSSVATFIYYVFFCVLYLDSPLTIESDSDEGDVVCLSPSVTPHKPNTPESPWLSKDTGLTNNIYSAAGTSRNKYDSYYNVYLQVFKSCDFIDFYKLLIQNV